MSTGAMDDTPDDLELLTPGEVARLFGVDPKTVTRWATAGKLTPLRTLGGHRRYRSTEVYEVLERSYAGHRPSPGRAGPEATSAVGEALSDAESSVADGASDTFVSDSLGADSLGADG